MTLIIQPAKANPPATKPESWGVHPCFSLWLLILTAFLVQDGNVGLLVVATMPLHVHFTPPHPPMNDNGELFSYLGCRIATFTFIWGYHPLAIAIRTCSAAHHHQPGRSRPPVGGGVEEHSQTHGNYDKSPNNVPVWFTTIYHRHRRMWGRINFTRIELI